jgi:ethanolamine utilization protein EutQ (cupin superfamily)
MLGMSDVKLFRMADLNLKPNDDGIVTAPVVNRRYSTGLGAGIGVFEKCEIEWTVTYDEVLFIKEATTLQVGDRPIAPARRHPLIPGHAAGL